MNLIYCFEYGGYKVCLPSHIIDWVDYNRRDSINVLHSLYLNENGPISNKLCIFWMYKEHAQGQYFALISHATTVLCYHPTSVHHKWIESYCLIRDLNIIHSKRTDRSFFKLNLTHSLDFIVKVINMSSPSVCQE